MKPELSAELTKRWHLEDATLIADTFTSHVFRARQHGQSVIVKCLKPRGEDELHGIDYLRWRGGHGAVRVLDLTGTNCLMEDAGEMSLLKYHQAKGDAAAHAELARFLPDLFAPHPRPAPATLPSLHDALSDLFRLAAKLDHRECDEPIRLAASLAERLLASQTTIRPLHGDIHHGNLVSPDGMEWRAIDPKGYLGDPHYDVANLFGNPLGAPELILSHKRAAELATMLAATLGLDRTRILQFAVAHCGASIAWSLKDTAEQSRKNLQERINLIPVLMSVLAD